MLTAAGRLGVAATVAAAGVFAWPPVVGLVQATSLADVAAMPGSLAGPPLPLLAMVVAAPLACSKASSAVLRTTCLGFAAGFLGLILLLLIKSGTPTDLSQYYPRKAQSVLVLAALPWVGALSARAAERGFARLEQSAGATRLRQFVRASAMVMAALTSIALVGPGATRPSSFFWQAVSPGAADMAAERRFDIAMELAEESRNGNGTYLPTVVGLTPDGDYPGGFVVSKLLSTRTGQPQTSGRALSVCQEAAELAYRGPVVVVTDLPASAMRWWLEQRGCAYLKVEHVPGADGRVVTRMLAAMGTPVEVATHAATAAAPS